MAKNSGKSLKIKCRLAFLNIRFEGLSNQDRIKKLHEVIGSMPWPMYLAQQGKIKEYKIFQHKFFTDHKKEMSARDKRNQELKKQQKAEAQAAREKRRQEKIAERMKKLEAEGERSRLAHLKAEEAARLKKEERKARNQLKAA